MIETTLAQNMQITLTDDSIILERKMLVKVIDISKKAGFFKEFSPDVRMHAQERLEQIDKSLTE